MMKIYLASGNSHKREEFLLLFPEHTIVLPSDEGIAFSFEETGKTYFENSWGKAQALFSLVGSPVLADDSGLSVEALDGAPGLYSARYGCDGNVRLTSDQQMDKLLAAMEGVADRRAAFVCCLTLIQEPLRFFSVQETFSGVLGTEKRGCHGFGYDPLFFPKGSRRSLAEYTPEEKAAVSHRSRAAAALHTLISSRRDQ